MNRIFCGMMLTFLIIGMLTSIILFSSRVNAVDEWVPYTPRASDVRFVYWKENGTSHMSVILRRSYCTKVSDWGTPIILGNNMSANAEVWTWTGGCVDAITFECHHYSLGELLAGEYLFIFEAWESPVKNDTFTVPPIPDYNTKPIVVDWTDLLMLARAYGSGEGEPNYDPSVDFNEDGEVNWKDLLVLAQNIGARWLF